MQHLPIRITDGQTEFDFEADDVSSLWIEGSFELKTFQLILDDDVIELDWDGIDSFYETFQPDRYPALRSLTWNPFKRYPIVLFERRVTDNRDTMADTLRRFKAAQRFRVKIDGKAADMVILTW